MTTGLTDMERVEKDADTVDEKYGPVAEVYAETRSEAADTAGDKAAKEHWRRVAATLRQDGEE